MFSYEEAGLCFDDMVRRSKEADTDVVARVLAGVQMVRVQLRMEMNYKNSTSRANQLELSGKAIKKPGQGDIDGMVSSLGTNMNMVGANEFDMAQQGKMMLNSGPGTAGVQYLFVTMSVKSYPFEK